MCYKHTMLNIFYFLTNNFSPLQFKPNNICLYLLCKENGKVKSKGFNSLLTQLFGGRTS